MVDSKLPASSLDDVTGDRLDVEYAALTQQAAVVDVNSRTRVELTGADRAGFLHNLCTNDIKRLTPGTGCEAFLLDARGHTLAHLFVICRPESLLLETVPGQEEAIVGHLDRYLIRERVELHARTAGWREWLLAGPRAADCLANLDIEAPCATLASLECELAGSPATVARVNLTEPDGFLLLTPNELGADIEKALLQSGARRCSLQTLEIARIENGFPFYGSDITEKNLPQEVARDQVAISFNKGCYLGQETVARIDALGHVNKTLCRLRFAGPDVPPLGTQLSAAGQPVGQVTSAAYSPRFSAPLALAYVRRGSHTPGTLLDSDAGPAEVLA
jgi:tRNA-modifying protein YgfZ